MKSGKQCLLNTNPEPMSNRPSYSRTVSFNPPVLKAMTGVPATKNSCQTIPPGSNNEGINPKSDPRLMRGPSLTNSSGLAQKFRGKFAVNSFILLAHHAECSSLQLAFPPMNICTLQLDSVIICYAPSKIKLIPFQWTMRPTNDMITHELSSFGQLKNFLCIMDLAFVWFPICSNYFCLFEILTPFSIAMGSGFDLRIEFNEEFIKISDIYEGETVAHLSQDSKAQREGLKISLFSVNNQTGKPWILANQEDTSIRPSQFTSRLCIRCKKLVFLNQLLALPYAGTNPVIQSFVTIIDGLILSSLRIQREAFPIQTSLQTPRVSSGQVQGNKDGFLKNRRVTLSSYMRYSLTQDSQFPI